MDVQPERVVAPDDVAEQLVVPPVVRCIDDALVLPPAPRMRARRRQSHAERFGQPAQLHPALAELLRRLGERLAAARPHLDLRGDQLPDEMRLQVGPLRGVADVLEAVDELERGRVEQRELLLDGDREVGNGLERRPRGREELLVPHLLLVAHCKKVSCRKARAGARPRRASPTCARRPGAPRRRGPSARRPAGRRVRAGARGARPRPRWGTT